ncbi:hypothetical protein H4582DRAFT_1123820 [Lactarius indigo]|nr:hypothetical protein H4582DRAFT_1123820 [Lactarius indigo]
MTRRATRQWQSTGGPPRARVMAGMSLSRCVPGWLSTFVHEYLPQRRRPVNIVNPRSVRLFPSMTRAWPLRLPASVDMTDRISRRVWTLALSLSTSCARLHPITRRPSFFPHLVSRLAFALVVTASAASTSSYYQGRTAHVARIGERTRSWCFKFPVALSESCVTRCLELVGVSSVQK